MTCREYYTQKQDGGRAPLSWNHDWWIAEWLGAPVLCHKRHERILALEEDQEVPTMIFLRRQKIPLTCLYADQCRWCQSAPRGPRGVSAYLGSMKGKGPRGAEGWGRKSAWTPPVVVGMDIGFVLGVQ